MNDQSNHADVPLTGAVLGLGNFDGVHRGHVAVLRAAQEQARRLQAPAGVLTFEPHPRAFFKPDQPPFRLTPAPAKARLLNAIGIDTIVTLDFSLSLSQLPARDFVDRILVGQYRARHVVAGHDFTFGHQRGGTMALLRDWLAAHAIGVTEVPPFRDAAGVVLSSSLVRLALQQGDLATAGHILGHPWAIAGTILHGAARARTLGYPTANMALGDYLRPKFGVYAIKARRVGAMGSFPGVANIGLRPTVDGASETLEFHLFDFNAAIYGEEWEVELHHFLRPEQKFAGLDALKAQIAADVAGAKQVL